MTMRVFLRYVNPVLAVLVLVLCIVAASTEATQRRLTFSGFFRDPFQVYFLAKGIFCSAALFLLGKLVEQLLLLAARASSMQPPQSAQEDMSAKVGSGASSEGIKRRQRAGERDI
jgi:hypothetical protein